MVVVVVAQDDVVHGVEVDLELAGVLLDGLGPGAGVEQDAVAVDLDEGGEAPLADSGVGQHRRENRDVERTDRRIGRRREEEDHEHEAHRVFRRKPISPIHAAQSRGHDESPESLAPRPRPCFPLAKMCISAGTFAFCSAS